MNQYVRRILGSTYEVEAVGDGLAALEAVRRSMPDLVLADVMMPRLDGLGLVRALRAEESSRGVPIVLLSAGAGEDSRIRGLAARADDYLVKPFSARELLARVGSHVQLAQLRRESEAARAAVERAATLEASEAQLRLITDALPVLISYVDAGRRFRFANRAYEEWLGCERGHLEGLALNEATSKAWPWTRFGDRPPSGRSPAGSIWRWLGRASPIGRTCRTGTAKPGSSTCPTCRMRLLTAA
jgi:CheY-like chemotaxis protein